MAAAAVTAAEGYITFRVRLAWLVRSRPSMPVPRSFLRSSGDGSLVTRADASLELVVKWAIPPDHAPSALWLRRCTTA
jgi:hypothetical protein